jgi:YVTN family beta-propeller protein
MTSGRRDLRVHGMRATLSHEAVAIAVIFLIVTPIGAFPSSTTQVLPPAPGASASHNAISDPAVNRSNLTQWALSRTPQISASVLSIGKVQQTLDLQNSTLIPGDFVPRTCADYSNALVLPSLDELFVTCQAPGVVVAFNATSGIVRYLDSVGESPAGLAFDSPTARLYVANNLSDNVSILNASSGRVTNSVTVEGSPDGLAIDPTIGVLLVSGFSTGNVTEISLLNDSVIGNLSIGPNSEPDGLCVNPANGNLYVAELGASSVGTLSVANGTLIGSTRLSAPPVAIGCDPDTGNVYAATFDSSRTLNVVTVIAGSSGREIANLTAGYYPDSIAVSPQDDYVFVSNGIWGNVSVFNGSTDGVVGSLPTGEFPDAITYDSASHEVFVANSESNDVTVCSDSPLRFVGVFAQNYGPEQIAWNGVTNSLFATTQFSGKLVDIAGDSSQIQSSSWLGYGLDGVIADSSNGHLYVSDPGGMVYDVTGDNSLEEVVHTGTPWGLAYDSLNGYVYVTNYAANNITIINSSRDSIVGWISLVGGELLGGNPEDVTFDATNGYLYVAVHGALGLNPGNISIIDGLTDRYLTSITRYWPGSTPGPSSAIIDNQNHELYVTDDYSDVLAAFNTTSNDLISATPVGVKPEGVTLDTQNGYLYVTNSGSNNVTVVNSSTNLAVGSITVGDAPWGVAFDPTSGDVYVANEGSGTISIVNETHYSITFTEVGLASGSEWGVSLANVTHSSSTAVVGFDVTNGTYPYVVEDIPGWHLTSFPYSGNITVTGAAIDQNLTWSVVVYGVSFVEAGLAAGTRWSVSCAGVLENSTESSLSFQEPNGSYSFSVGTVPGWHLITSSGSGRILVNGSSVTTTLDWAVTQFDVIFSESGLPSGSSWEVILNGSLEEATTTAISFAEPNGSYNYAIGGPPGWHVTGYLRTGSVIVDGSSSMKTISWTVTTYPLTFIATGLPVGRVWTVSVSGSILKTNSSSVAVVEPNGSYQYSVASPAGYEAVPSSGNISIGGSPSEVTIHFESTGGHPTGVPTYFWWAIGIGGPVVVLLAFSLWRCNGRRKRSEGVARQLDGTL